MIRKLENLLKEIVAKELRTALTIRVRWEKRRDEKTGQPLATPEIVEKEEYLPAFIVTYLPYVEGALRGMQETTDRVKNGMGEDRAVLANVASVMLQVEDALRVLVGSASTVQRRALRAVADNSALSVKPATRLAVEGASTEARRDKEPE